MIFLDKAMLRNLLRLLMALTTLTLLPAQAQFKVLTSFTVLADMAKQIVGERAQVNSLTEFGAEVHDYQPKPQQIVQALQADLILWNGMNLERWYQRFLQDVKDTPSVIVSKGIAPISIYSGDYRGKPNPHAWMSPSNALIYVDNMLKAFVKHDADNASYYRRNAGEYKQKLKQMQTWMRQQVRQIPVTQRVLVSSEGAFSYLAKDLGFKEIYLWPINADRQGTPRQIKRVIDAVRHSGVPVVFSESTVSAKPAQQVAAETGARYGGVLYVDSISQADGPVPSYLQLLQVTLNTIISGFKPLQ